MLLAYLTADEAHRDRAVQMARDFRIDLFLGDWATVQAQGVFLQMAGEDGVRPDSLPFLDQSPATVRPEAVVYDVDSLSSCRRQEILSRLMAGLSSCPAAVHSRRLGATQQLALQLNGVAVFPELDPELFWMLRLLVKGPDPSLEIHEELPGYPCGVMQLQG